VPGMLVALACSFRAGHFICRGKQLSCQIVITFDKQHTCQHRCGEVDASFGPGGFSKLLWGKELRDGGGGWLKNGPDFQESIRFTIINVV
jgi:hypothetical protein